MPGRELKTVMLFLVISGVTGCAGLMKPAQILEVTITPQTVYPGSIVTIQVKAPIGTQAVTGRLDMPGSPVVHLKTKDEGRTWTFTTQIPLTAVWDPGRYQIVVQGRAPDGSRCRGEAWVAAP
jgi:uncharacterized protein YceK